MPIRLSIVLLTFLSLCPHRANAQEQYSDEPTAGIHLPASGLAGEVDATTVTVNPAGIAQLTAPELVLALDLQSDDTTVRNGPGGGVFLGSVLGGGYLPKLHWGLALEWLRPARPRLAPDPGTPLRLSLSTAFSLGSHSSIGIGWHHFYDEGHLDGMDTFDIGWTSRFGSYWALGLVVRDLTGPTIGSERIQRRYETELAIRPFATDRLDLGLGVRIGEKEFDITNGEGLDSWLKYSLRVSRGVYLRGEVGSHSVLLSRSDDGASARAYQRDLRVTTGLELSFGGMSTALYGSIGKVDDGAIGGSGGTWITRFSPRSGSPSLFQERKRIERLDLRGGISQRQLTAILVYLQRVVDNDSVVALVINFDGANGGWATLHEIREAVLRVRAAGKKVFSFMVSGDTKQYFVASAANKVFLDPAGGIWLQGFAGTTMYFASLFAKLGVKAQFVRIEEYKSAPESYTRTGPTEPAFRMRNDLYDSIYATLLKDIATSRNLSPAVVGTLIDKGPYTAGELQSKTQLIDKVVSPDDLSDVIAEEMGREYPIGSAPQYRPETWDRRKVAVIYLTGDIVGGQSRTVPLLGRTLVGGHTIAQAVAEASGDRDIEAIVLRINSPGGSALASEVMARAVNKAAKSKPVICSMADMAASGGYMAAAYCDRIFADSMTITGSIGIFNGTFDISNLLQKLGLTWTTYKRGANSDFGSMYRPMTETETKMMKDKIRYYYGRFVDMVAEGRGMTQKQVNEVGRGHVWTGEQAIDIKLVDQIGGLQDAIDYATARAGMTKDDKISIVMLPEIERSVLGNLLGAPFGAATDAPIQDSQGARGLWLSLLPGNLGKQLLEAIPHSVWMEPGSVQARLPFSILWN